MNVTRTLLQLSVGIFGLSLGLLTVGPEERRETVRPEQPVVQPVKETDSISSLLALLTHRGGTLEEMAEIGRSVRGLSAEGKIELARRLERMPGREADEALKSFIMAWSHVDPDGAESWVLPRLDDHDRFDVLLEDGMRGERDLLLAWGRICPEKALGYLRNAKDSRFERDLLKNVFPLFRARPEAEQLEMLRGITSEKLRRDMMVELFASWANSEASSALGAALSFSSRPERTRMAGEVLIKMATSDSVEAFRKSASLGFVDPDFRRLLACSAASADAELTVRLIEESGDQELIAKCGPKIVAEWIYKDPVAAFRWAEAHGYAVNEGDQKDPDFDVQEFWGDDHRSDLFSLRGPLEMGLRMMGSKQTMDWLKSLPPGVRRDDILEGVISASYNEEVLGLVSDMRPDLRPQLAARRTQMFGMDLQKMQDFAQTLPEGAEREAAWAIIGQRTRDPIETKPGPDRDAMLAAMVRDRGRDWKKVFELVQQISDSQKRRDAFDDLAFRMEGWENGDDGRPLDKLLKLPGVPDEWKWPWAKW